MKRLAVWALIALGLLTACSTAPTPRTQASTYAAEVSSTAVATRIPSAVSLIEPFDFCRANGTMSFSEIAASGFTGPLYPFRSGVFAWQWRCAGGSVETCTPFASSDGCGQDGWQPTSPSTAFTRPVPPAPTLAPLPQPNISGPGTAFTDPHAYCAAIGDTPERFGSQPPQQSNGPQWVGEDLPFPHPSAAGSVVAAWRCDGGIAVACVARAMGQNCLRTRDVSEQHDDLECRSFPNEPVQSNARNSGRYYQWGCSGGTSVIIGYRDGPATRLDRYGYARSQWKPMQDVTLADYSR